MNHIFIFFNLFVLLTGVAAVAIAGSIYVKTRAKPLFHYLVYIISFTLFIFSYLVVLSYVNLNIIDLDFTLLLLIIAASLLSIFLFMFSIPYFTHSLVYEKPARSRNLAAGILAVAALLSLTRSLRVNFDTETIIQEPNVWMYLSLTLFFITAAYSIIIKALSLGRLDEARRRIVRVIMILRLLLLPGFIVDIFLLTRHQVMVFLPLYYCIFSILSTVYITRRYLAQLASMSYGLDEAAATEELERAGISAREREIILLMSKGFSNKHIADELFISVNTVKTHIQNIFKKMGVKSRFELVIKLKQVPMDARFV